MWTASTSPLQPTSKNRGWLIDPLGTNPWWTLLVAALPALLCTILIFMDQQITAVIINRKEHKLKVRPAFIPFDSVLDVLCNVCGYPFFTTQQGIL